MIASKGFGRPGGLRGHTLGQGELDIDELTRGISDLIDKLPGNIAGAYEQRLTACQAILAGGGLFGLVTGGKCLYDLFQDAKDAYREAEAGAVVPITMEPRREPEVVAPGVSPWVVGAGVAGAAGLGYLAYLAFK